ncbi:hypothetical protein KAU88_05695 [Candidatus Bathyarchaeota archaeon]|nr:hypothetical protein [Candidatus Bathyarchaeota archaeon]
MRARLKEADVQFILNLLHKEKERHDVEMEDLQHEIDLLEVWVKKWRWKLINYSYFEFRDGFKYMKSRLSFLKSQQHFVKMFRYSRVLHYLTRRYESMLRGKAGRPLGVSSWGYSDLKAVLEEGKRP